MDESRGVMHRGRAARTATADRPLGRRRAVAALLLLGFLGLALWLGVGALGGGDGERAHPGHDRRARRSR